tara:strand:+ start:761 stop:862 length:102 start_codon:yes stop_codon:yes gene_type:complete
MRKKFDAREFFDSGLSMKQFLKKYGFLETKKKK